jgi:chemotaxis-related protein WspD
MDNSSMHNLPAHSPVLERSLSDGSLSDGSLSDGSLSDSVSGALSCWKQVGMWGDRTCEQLTQVAHCKDCSVYVAAGAKLLERPAPKGYRERLTTKFAANVKQQPEKCSVLVFRLDKEWLALPANLCQQILPPVNCHRLPHRSNATLKGIVNVRGQLLLKISLAAALGLSATSLPSENLTKSQLATKNVLSGTNIYSRMVVIEKARQVGTPENWVFDVDELYGIHAIARKKLETVAAGVSAGAEACTSHVFLWKTHRVNLLDADRLFETLRQQAL